MWIYDGLPDQKQSDPVRQHQPGMLEAISSFSYRTPGISKWLPRSIQPK
jgi:hypothetical protein